MPRNPIIAKLFRMINLAENAGYGFDKMETGWQLYSHSKPVFEQGIDFTNAEFYFPIKGGQEKGLTKRQKEVLLLIKENPTNSRRTLSEKLGVNESAVQKHIDALRAKGVIQRQGPDKGGYWEIIESQ